jgi:hypothetical protein
LDDEGKGERGGRKDEKEDERMTHFVSTLTRIFMTYLMRL